MRLNVEHNIYEYVAVYVDDLEIAMKNCNSFIAILKERYKFKLKGTGTITYHLSMNFFRDKDQMLCMAPRKYIEKICGSFERMFRHLPKQVVTSPIEKTTILRFTPPNY